MAFVFCQDLLEHFSASYTGFYVLFFIRTFLNTILGPIEGLRAVVSEEHFPFQPLAIGLSPGLVLLCCLLALESVHRVLKFRCPAISSLIAIASSVPLVPGGLYPFLQALRSTLLPCSVGDLPALKPAYLAPLTR
jgi:hypothetical protein